MRAQFERQLDAKLASMASESGQSEALVAALANKLAARFVRTLGAAAAPPTGRGGVVAEQRVRAQDERVALREEQLGLAR